MALEIPMKGADLRPNHSFKVTPLRGAPQLNS